MSRSFPNNIANYLETGTSGDVVIDLTGHTVLTWVKTNDKASEQCFFFSGRSDSGSAFVVTAIHSTSGDARTYNRADNTFSVTSNVIADNTWTPVVGTFTTAASGQLCVLGDNWSSRGTGTATTAYNPLTTNNTCIGAFRDDTPGAPMNGYIAHVAVWDSVLSDADIQSLIAGTDPDTIGVASQLHYWPLTTTSLTDEWGSSDLSIQGTVAFDADNPTLSGGGASSTDVNFTGVGRGIARGVARGVG